MAGGTRYSGWGRALWAEGRLDRPHALDRIDPTSPALGNRRSYGDAPLNNGGAANDMTALDRILQFDEADGLLTVEAGATLGDLLRLYAPRGWKPAVLPGTGFATVGGAVAMDVHGKNHHTAGSFGDHLASVTLLMQGGQRRITPKSGAIWKATLGGLGQTGIVTQATLRMAPCPGTAMLVTERRAPDWEAHLDLLSARASHVVGWIDATATGKSLGRGIVEEGEIARGLTPPRGRPRAVPFNAPHFALNPIVVKAFNAAYYARVPSHGRTVVRALDDFYFPLDRIHDWNRLYGRRGFHQFQCVVPLAQTDALRAMLDRIARAGQASPLAVLKRLGPGNGNYMSFPMEGWTLAIDFPNRPQSVPLIKGLEEMAREAGGRIYLAKDALASGETIRAMYPDHPKWAAQAAKADPERHYATDMVRRLELRT